MTLAHGPAILDQEVVVVVLALVACQEPPKGHHPPVTSTPTTTTPTLSTICSPWAWNLSVLSGATAESGASATYQQALSTCFGDGGPVGDVDGDGVDDLVLNDVAKLRLLSGASIPTDPAPEDLPVVSKGVLSGFGIGDVDGDGLADLGVWFPGDPDDRFELRSGAGLLRGDPPLATLDRTYPRSCDVDGDGASDLVFNVDPDRTGVFFAPFSGAIDPAAPDAVVEGYDLVPAGDVDGDGRCDLAGGLHGPVGLALGSDLAPGADVTPRAILDVTSLVDVLPAGDLDGDGRDELWLRVTLEGFRGVVVLSGATLASPDLWLPSMGSMFLADLDGDGTPEVVAATGDSCSSPDYRAFHGLALDGTMVAREDGVHVADLWGRRQLDPIGDVDQDGADDLLLVEDLGSTTPGCE